MPDRSQRGARTPADLYGLDTVKQEALTRREALRRGGAVAAAAAVFPSDFAERLARIAPQDAIIPWTNAP